MNWNAVYPGVFAAPGSAVARLSLIAGCALGLFTILPATLNAHDPQASSEESADFASNRHAGLRLTAKLVPATAIAGDEATAKLEDSPAAAKAIRELALDHARKYAANEDRSATVGEIAYLVIRLERGGQPLSGAEFELLFDHIEDDKTVFETKSGTTDGEWVWGQQFFDGAQHRVQIRATGPGSGEALETRMVVDVEGISPPPGSIFRSLFLLLSVVALGMAIGYWFGVRGAAGRNL